MKVFFFSSFWISRWQACRRSSCSGWFHILRKFLGIDGILNWCWDWWACSIIVENDWKRKLELNSTLRCVIMTWTHWFIYVLICFSWIICSDWISTEISCISFLFNRGIDVLIRWSVRSTWSRSIEPGWLVWWFIRSDWSGSIVNSRVNSETSGVGSGVGSWWSWFLTSYFLSSGEAAAVCCCEDSSDKDFKSETRMSSQSLYR